jgi:predicted TIM-barrel fold metal-dependent hydrolase
VTLRDGFKIFDADTHLRPSAESIRPYLSSKVLEKIPDLDEHTIEIKVGMAGEKRQPPLRHWYRFRGGGEGKGWGGNGPRYLGEAGKRPNEVREFQTFMGSRFPTEGGGDWSAEIRLKDMDEEGIDVHYLVGGGGGGHPDHELEEEFIRASHRYLNDFCMTDPHRLKAGLHVSPKHMELSIEQIHEYGKQPWAVAIHPALPIDYPLDHPDLDALWGAAQEEGLVVVHHSFSTGYPGQRDLWDNPFMGRLASHPWGAMRAVGAFFGGGIMDRFPNIKFGILESGFGWLPFWAKRMDDQVVYMGYVNENLEYKMSEYMTGGRFFAAIVLHEGESMVKMVTDQLGDHILMMGSDYPHAESRFPESAKIPLSWKSITDDQKRKLFWDNPVRFFGEP